MITQPASPERSEREHSIDILVKILADVLANVETIARISEQDLSSIRFLCWFGQLAHHLVAQ